MFQSSWFVLLLSAQCLTVVVSLKIPSLSPGEIFVNASFVKTLKDLNRAPPILNTTGNSASNGNAPSCPGCSVGKRDEDKIRIEIIKRKILYQLQMTEPPKSRMRGKRLPTLLTQMKLTETRQQNTEPVDADDTVSKPLQFMVVGERVKLKAQKDRSKSLLLRFPFSSKIYRTSIASVKLWVHKHKRSNAARQIRRLVVKDLDDPSQSTGRRFKPEEKGWIALDVTAMAQKWMRKDSIKSQGGNTSTYRHTIQIDCANCESAKKVIHYSADNHRPILVIDLDTSKTRRRKRRSADCVAGMKKCCLRRLYVNFTTLGWDKWIVTPAGFQVNYCTGSCLGHGLPRFHHSNVIQFLTNQTIIQCCSPSRLSDVSMLYFDDRDTIIKKDLLNLKVEDCKCA